MSSAEAIFIYVPCASKEEAQKIGRVLVEENLVACANIFNGPHSIYEWKGKVEEAEEVLLLLKTRKDLFGKVEARVKALHSYEIPCIAALPLAELNDSYAGWILKQTEAK